MGWPLGVADSTDRVAMTYPAERELWAATLAAAVISTGRNDLSRGAGIVGVSMPVLCGPGPVAMTYPA